MKKPKATDSRGSKQWTYSCWSLLICGSIDFFTPSDARDTSRPDVVRRTGSRFILYPLDFTLCPSLPHQSTILAICTSNPVPGSSEVRAKAVKSLPVSSVRR